jgi:predicted nucleotidyltransferase
VYDLNRKHPLFNDFHRIVLKHFGIDRLVEQVVDVDRVWLTGDMARGLYTPIIDIVLIGKEIDRSYLAELTEKAEKLLEKKIRTVVYYDFDDENLSKPRLWVFGE